MMRKIVIGLAAIAIATAGSTLSASALQGKRTSHGGAMTKSSSLAKRSFGPRAYGFEGRGYEGRRYGGYEGRGYEGRYGYPRPYGHRYYREYGSYGSPCWSRIWTPEGWQRQWVCGHPYRYGEYRYGPHYRGYRYGYGEHRYGRPYDRYRYGESRGPYYGRK
jgi:hypothetical protein